MIRVLFVFLTICLLTCAPSDSQEEDKTFVKSQKPDKPDSLTILRVKDTTRKPPPLINVDTLESKTLQHQNTKTLKYIMGKFDPTKHEAFTKIEDAYSTRSGLLLRKETYEAFKKMHAAAAKDGVNLNIISATRNFNVQKSIWEAKWTGARKIENGKDASKSYPNPKTRALKILEYSSMPGSSRHHWGTDIDINNLTNSYFEKGKGLKEYKWLTTYARDYGFCQPYTAGRPHGYHEEKWHWSYLPLALELTQQAKSYLKDDMIKGFKGAEVATDIGIVEKYVLGINQECL